MENKGFITVNQVRKINEYRRNGVERFWVEVPLRNRVVGYSLMGVSFVAPDFGICGMFGYALTTEETFKKSIIALPSIIKYNLKRVRRFFRI